MAGMAGMKQIGQGREVVGLLGGRMGREEMKRPSGGGWKRRADNLIRGPWALVCTIWNIPGRYGWTGSTNRHVRTANVAMYDMKDGSIANCIKGTMHIASRELCELNKQHAAAVFLTINIGATTCYKCSMTPLTAADLDA
jgi:hypothetical protein